MFIVNPLPLFIRIYLLLLNTDSSISSAEILIRVEKEEKYFEDFAQKLEKFINGLNTPNLPLCPLNTAFFNLNREEQPHQYPELHRYLRTHHDSLDDFLKESSVQTCPTCVLKSCWSFLEMLRFRLNVMSWRMDSATHYFKIIVDFGNINDMECILKGGNKHDFVNEEFVATFKPIFKNDTINVAIQRK